MTRDRSERRPPAPTLQQQARALGDPTRHEIFRYIRDAARPVTVAELTAHLGCNHNAVRQHLAKLLDAGLISGSTERGSGRGRPRLVYRVAPAVEGTWGVAGPYERLSRILAEMIQRGESPLDGGRRVGRELATPSDTPTATVADITEVMASQGFEPDLRVRSRRADIVLGNCPFESVALSERDVVCTLHRGIAEGLAEAGTGVVVEELIAKDPRRAGCRLRLAVAPA